MAGQFHGRVVAEWLSNKGPDRNMELLEPFAFTSPDGVRWNVPAGSVVNGASIPRLLWSWGPPFVGNYRRASVVHDHYCTTKERTYQSTHMMFRDACVAGGVSAFKAGKMYTAVRVGGPKWPPPGAKLAIAPGQGPRDLTEEEYLELIDWIEATAPDISEIEQRIEQMERPTPVADI